MGLFWGLILACVAESRPVEIIFYSVASSIKNCLRDHAPRTANISHDVWGRSISLFITFCAVTGDVGSLEYVDARAPTSAIASMSIGYKLMYKQFSAV